MFPASARKLARGRGHPLFAAHTLGGHEIEGFAGRVVDDPVGEDLAVVIDHRLEAKDSADGQVEIVVAVEGKFNVHDPVIPAVPKDGKENRMRHPRGVPRRLARANREPAFKAIALPVTRIRARPLPRPCGQGVKAPRWRS